MKNLLVMLTSLLTFVSFSLVAEAKPKKKHYNTHNVEQVDYSENEYEYKPKRKHKRQYREESDTEDYVERQQYKRKHKNKNYEREDTLLGEALTTGGDLIDKASQYIGSTARDLGLPSSLWCADFMNKVTGSGHDRTARSYLHRGSHASHGCTNCVVVLSRGGGGHVGIVKGYDSNDNPIVISGNHGGRVGVGVYSKSRVLGYRNM